MGRATIADVAREAGVSIATVNRVLAGYQGVRPATAARVLEAAETTGFYGAGAIRRRLNAEAPARSFGFVLQQRSMPFFAGLAAMLVEETMALREVRGRSQVDFSDDLDPATTARRLMALGEACDAVAIMSADHPLLTRAVEALAGRGVPVFTMVSDLSAAARRGYVGADERRLGRTAAWLTARIAGAGEVGILLGSHRHLCQEQREIGFRSFMREHAPGFTVLEPYLTHEVDHLAFDVTEAILKRHPELRALFVPGGGIAGVLRALRDLGASRDLCVIGVERNPETHAAFEEGLLTAILAHPVRDIARNTVRSMAEATLAPDRGETVRVVLPFEVLTPENA
jgi:LacI family transcriptional regulator